MEETILAVLADFVVAGIVYFIMYQRVQDKIKEAEFLRKRDDEIFGYFMRRSEVIEAIKVNKQAEEPAGD